MKKITQFLLIISLFSPTITFASFDKNLSAGATGSSVRELQTFLTTQGLYTGPITSVYGPMTTKAVSIFQVKYNIKPASGTFGLITRTQANKLNTKTQISSSVPTIAGCISSSGYSATSGLSCSGNGSCSSGNTYDSSINQCIAPLKYCQNRNGLNATYDSVANSCGCAAGYTYDGKSCVVVQIKTGYQICSETFPNETWNGTYSNEGKYNCVCQTGYVPNISNTGCQLPVLTNYSVSSSPIQDSYVSLGRNKGAVVFSKSGCDYYLVETSLGYSLLEWYGGFFQSEGDIIYGNLNSYGFKDITNSYGSSGRVWIDDWMLSKSRAIEKYYDKCD